MNSKNLTEVIGGIIIGCIIIAASAFIMAFPVWLLWNWLMPTIFGLIKITLVQAWGLAFLSNCLFKSVSHKE